jgi:hypothetical protein
MLFLNEGGKAEMVINIVFHLLLVLVATNLAQSPHLKEFGVTQVIVICVISAVRYSSGALGIWVNSLMPKTQPLKKHKSMKKFCDQMWMLFVHASMSVFEYYLLYDVLREDSLWENPWNAFSPCPPFQKENLDATFHPELRIFYFTQLSIWLFTAVSCLYFEERRKDFIEMMSHHIFTIALVFGSMVNGYMRIGLLVQTIHDVSDVLLDIMKTLNYLQLDGPKGFFLTEISFVANLIGWIYFRLYVYPLYIIDSSLTGFHKQCANEHNGDFLKNPNPSNMPFWNLANVFLTLLLVLHIWWFYLMIRIALKLISGADPHDVGKEEYEGEDD